MTTIAYRDGKMACDSCWSLDGMVDTLATKIVRLSSGALLGQAGAADGRALVAMLDEVDHSEELPTCEELSGIKSESLALLVLPNGQVFKIGTNKESDEIGIWEVSERVAAIGSGTSIARTAMYCGKSAREAVEIGCVFDMNSRGPVHEVQL